VCAAVCCSVLQCAAVCCSVLQCAAVWCSVMHQRRAELHSCRIRLCDVNESIVWQGVAGCCSVLQCIAVCCSVLQCAAVYCSVQQCAAVWCSSVFCIRRCNLSESCHKFCVNLIIFLNSVCIWFFLVIFCVHLTYFYRIRPCNVNE